MTRAELLAELKSVLRETTYDAAWGDTRLILYMSEGQDRFCEETGFFIDAVNYTVTLIDGQASYSIPDRVIQVLEVWDGARRLGKFEERDRAPHLGDSWDPGYTDTAVGLPGAWQTDKSTGLITFYPVPNAASAGKVFTLRVWRRSRYALTNNDIDPGVPVTPAAPEIPERFQLSLVEYAAYKALMQHDMEQQDKVKASDHLAVFTQYIREGKRFFREYHGIETKVGFDQAYRA
jgi:hypothetical protein